MENAQRAKSVEQKKQQLQELLLQEVDKPPALCRISLPFILVNTSKDTIIQCEMSEDRQDIFFNFSGPFEINDDSEILKRMNLHHVAEADAATHIPEKLIRYLPPDYLV
ncbi:hypothetical protein DYB37_004122 [Aphanomyces astaci]|uniref:Transcription factor DP C-terminal domain-containing protein n=1 Tax=Aphanomyces astaci TaxID=112090 RepID=A0A3R6XU46_APHAT|nr:hypothetical protein DYB35_003567 [Aphanomyces astaci]RHZ11016.1 hypothetical protein DYB37_004122 [Aphanomyces astaci]